MRAKKERKNKMRDHYAGFNEAERRFRANESPMIDSIPKGIVYPTQYIHGYKQFIRWFKDGWRPNTLPHERKQEA